MNRHSSVATAAALVVVVAGVAPAVAATGKARPKPIKGTWSYTDATPDPTVSVMNTAKKLGPHCDGDLPSAPTDVNVHAVKVKGKGTLTLSGHNTGDWALDIRDPKNIEIGSSDGGTPQDQEGTLVTITKAGSYKVYFCNLGGGPTATLDYVFTYR